MLGSGTELDPYQVETASDLDDVRNNLSAYYIQMADIDLSNYENWVPIGTEPNPFTGNYDFNGYTLSNLTINRPGIEYIGLFGYTDGFTQEMDSPKWVELKNARLTSVNIIGKNFVGALVGEGYFTKISSSSSSGSIVGDGCIGGLIGYQWHTDGTTPSLINSYSNCNVTSTKDWDGTGGLVGLAGTPVVNCYATGIVNGNNDSCSGGLIGSYNSSVPVVNSYYDSQTSGQTDTGKGIPKTTPEMKLQSTFVDWDFSTIWKISSTINNGYPSFITAVPSQLINCKSVRTIITPFYKM